MTDTTGNAHGINFLVDKSDLKQQRFEYTDSTAELLEGQIRLAVDKFALTANNITYAAFGDVIGYWRFFPCTDEKFGRVPVWGFADVIESRHSDISTGERFYGFLPISTELIATPVSVSSSGFVDGAEHRHGLPPIYNQYTSVSGDPSYIPALEAQQMILRPLFMTSFLIEDFLVENESFGAERVILSSASSKTAIGVAYQIAHAEQRVAELVGLTSEGNKKFVGELGLYDTVVGYDDIEKLDPDRPTVFIDIAGNGDVICRLHAHLGDQLKYSCLVGASHWDADSAATDSLQPKPVWFFAPDQFLKRVAEIGASGVLKQFAAAWSGFVGATDQWMNIVELNGEESIQRTFAQLLDGTAPPSDAFILSFGDSSSSK
jgi:hypothetical protein